MAIDRGLLGLQLPVTGLSHAETFPFEVLADPDFGRHL